MSACPEQEKRQAAAGATLVGLGVALFALMSAYPERLKVPAPVGYVTAAILALAGLLAFANAFGSRRIRRWLAVALLSCMVVPSAWIAVGPGQRTCAAAVGLLFGLTTGGACRVAFGIGALIQLALVLVALRYALAGGEDEG
jgi:hypothetical protein